MENIFRWIKSLFVENGEEEYETPKSATLDLEDVASVEDLFKDANEAYERSKFPYSLL